MILRPTAYQMRVTSLRNLEAALAFFPPEQLFSNEAERGVFINNHVHRKRKKGVTREEVDRVTLVVRDRVRNLLLAEKVEYPACLVEGGERHDYLLKLLSDLEDPTKSSRIATITDQVQSYISDLDMPEGMLFWRDILVPWGSADGMPMVTCFLRKIVDSKLSPFTEEEVAALSYFGEVPTVEKIEACKKDTSLLVEAFNWRATREGFLFWAEVIRNPSSPGWRSRLDYLKSKLPKKETVVEDQLPF